jgi:hypothetical protein
MSRTPPAYVLRSLRSEVGFGCPVPGCGNPYLEWHHFDPPFANEEHHRPEGMIALCAEHHKKADAGAYTNEQLRSFKTNRANAESVRGAFEWLRNDLLAIVGGNFYYETLRVIQVDGIDVVSFIRDEEGYLRLNVQMLSLSAQQRARIEENIWSNIGTPNDLKSPPSGKFLQIKYETGDQLSVEFFELASIEAATNRYGPTAFREPVGVRFPITAVEVNLAIGSAGITLSPKGTNLPGNNRLTGCFVVSCGIGVSLNTGLPWRQNTIESQVPRYPRNAPCPCNSGNRYKQCHGLVR